MNDKTAKLQTGTLVSVYDTKIWIESDMVGARHVMVEHQVPGCEPFCYASFHYDYRYTRNSGTHQTAEALAKSLGATEPIEHRSRSMRVADPGDVDWIEWAEGEGRRKALEEAASLRDTFFASRDHYADAFNEALDCYREQIKSLAEKQ